MVVLTPILEGERSKRCTRCGTIGLCSPVGERSSFYPRRRDGGYRAECRRCTTAQTVRFQQARKARDPERARERQRAASRRWNERHREQKREQGLTYRQRMKESDPEGLKVRERERQRRYQAKLRKDPRRLAAARERDRMNRELRVQRAAGTESRAAKERREKVSDLVRYGVRYRVGPFQLWLAQRLARGRRAGTVSHVKLAQQLGVTVRSISRWMDVEGFIDEAVLDRVTARIETLSVGDIYPRELEQPTPARGVLAWLSLVERSSPVVTEVIQPPTKCCSPGCAEPVAEGRFCQGHREMFASLREDLESEGRAMSANGGVPRREIRGRKTKVPTCCNPYCFSPREPGERFCSPCAEAGWVEDEDGMELAVA